MKESRPRRAMTAAERQKRHVLLHRMFDELLAAYLAQPRPILKRASILDPIAALMKWSYEQTRRRRQ